MLDTGALVAAERGDRRFWILYKIARDRAITPLIPTPVLAEVWRGGGPRQTLLSRALQGCEPLPPGEEVAKRAGALLAATGGDNAVDALVVAAAEQSHDEVVTADVTDLVELAAHAGGVTIRHLGA